MRAGRKAPEPGEPRGVLGDAVAYDPDADAWRTLPDLPAPQLDATVTWTGDALHVLGQPVDGRGAPMFVAYPPDNDRWETLPAPPAEAQRNGSTAVWSGAELFVWGSTADGTATRGSTWRPPDSG